jgi:acyl-CoA reductase-like NAD-dependent aldehyde dehydrogenase
MTVREYANWIGNTWIKSNDLIDRMSPAHGGILARFPNGSGSDVDHAVAAARAAFDDRSIWSAIPSSDRAKRIAKWADLIEQNLTRLSEIEAEEVGKPIRFARSEIEWSIELARYAASLAWQMKGDAFSNLGDANLGLVLREPVGVVAMITPWNFPLVTLFQKVPYALAAGCTVVVKPSELTAGTTLEIGELAKQAGIPSGVYNVVVGTGVVVGEALTGHPDVDMISFTGSTAVGKCIAQRAAANMKRFGMELGGKGANIVFADADLDAAVDGALLGYILNSGQECCQSARLLIEAGVADAFLAKLIERSRRLRIGLPLDPESDLGSVIHGEHLEKILGFIEIGVQEGATLALGGKRLKEGAFAKGFYVEPTIFSDVTPSMRIAREEIFGPVLTVMKFSSPEEAVKLANDTNYGLAAGLWTKSIDKAIQCSRELKSGMIYFNTYLETSPQLPFGGYKESGVGRENGAEGLQEFMEVKSVFMKLGKRPDALPHTRP